MSPVEKSGAELARPKAARASQERRDALKSALTKDTRIHAWQIRNAFRTGRQTYLVGTQLEFERDTHGETLEAVVFVRNG